MSKRIWISWETQRRNRTLSKELNATLFEFDIKKHRIVRYGCALAKTCKVLLLETPTIVFVQNPSLVLAVCTVAYGKIWGIPVVVDAHYAGLHPLDGRNAWMNMVARYVMRTASLTIVTNDNSQKYVEQNGGRGVVITDPIPEFPVNLRDRVRLKGQRNILFICTYSADEPYHEVIRAAEQFEDSVVIYISGKIPQREKDLIHSIPRNVVLTGYLPEEEYVRLLHSVDVVIDLTTREDCLVCGAYESIAAEQPLIVSGSSASKAVFRLGTLYTDNTAGDLVVQINHAYTSQERLRQGIKELKRSHMEGRAERLSLLEDWIEKMEHGILPLEATPHS